MSIPGGDRQRFRSLDDAINKAMQSLGLMNANWEHSRIEGGRSQFALKR